MMNTPSTCFLSSPAVTSKSLGSFKAHELTARRWCQKPVASPSHGRWRVRFAYSMSTPEDSTPCPPPSPSSSPPGATKKLSKTEEIALKLGQSKDSMKAKQEEIFTERKMSNRNKIINLTVCIFIAVALFLTEKLNPNSGANLLRYMQQNSADASVIGNGQPTLVEFSAGWCQSCQDMSSHIFSLENEYFGKVNFVVIDSEKQENGDIVEKYNVDGIPQFTLLDGKGETVTEFVGFTPESILAEDLDALISNKPVPHRGISTAELENTLINK